MSALRSTLLAVVLGVCVPGLLGCGSPLVDSASKPVPPRVGRYGTSVPSDTSPDPAAPARNRPVTAPASLSEVPDAPAHSVVRIPQRNEDSRFHEVQGGETLASIARRYNRSVPALRQANGLAAEEGIQAGQFLLVPR